MSWTDGYISDVRYPAFFYREMQPLWLSTLAQWSGFAAPDPDRPFSACELGCGVGVNLLVAAACHPYASFVGVDFNADHLALARDAATSCGIDNVTFVHADFATFASTHEDRFDFMTSHGVWSWVSPDQRTTLLDVAARSLKQGGLFYLHYMCHPGSTDLLPVQHLLNLCAHHMPGPSPRKAEVGLKLLQQMADSGLFADRPHMVRHLANMARRAPADLAHEFLTDHWHPQHSVDLHQQVGRTGLRYLTSADVFNNLDASLSIPGRMQPLIRQTQIPALAEALKDMARNAHQRMDLFQNAPAPLPREAVIAAIDRMRFTLLPGAPSHGPLIFQTPIGPITGAAEIFTPLLQRLATGHASGAELRALPAFSGDAGALLQSLQLLMMQGIAHPLRHGPVAQDGRIDALAQWFTRNGVGIAIIAPCATATLESGRV